MLAICVYMNKNIYEGWECTWLRLYVYSRCWTFTFFFTLSWSLEYSLDSFIVQLIPPPHKYIYHTHTISISLEWWSQLYADCTLQLVHLSGIRHPYDITRHNVFQQHKEAIAQRVNWLRRTDYWKQNTQRNTRLLQHIYPLMHLCMRGVYLIITFDVLIVKIVNS